VSATAFGPLPFFVSLPRVGVISSRRKVLPQMSTDQARSSPPLAEGPDLASGERSEADLLSGLRCGEEAAFADIVVSWSPMLLRVARTYVSTDASAQEIVQETWLAVVRGLDRFEGRSSLKTWVFRILTNLGKTRGVGETRTVPWSSLFPVGSSVSTVDPGRFQGPEDEWPHHWTPVGTPQPWEPTPEEATVASETRREIARALVELPERQRAVVALRDVHGMSPDEVCLTLTISAVNQRVLLHRGRARLREVLEDYYRGPSQEMSS
jgi:RNA polymerase sigma-70 factor (ECF subfamily)